MATTTTGASKTSSSGSDGQVEHHPSVSVIVATYNRGPVLFDTIEMVVENDYPNFELIVVDQTPDPTPDYRERLETLRVAHDLRCVRLPEPSLTFARNEGIRQAKGDLVVFVDDDVELGADFISQHVHAFAGDSSIGGVAGRVFDEKYDDGVPDGPTGCILPDGHITGNFYSDRPQEVDYGRGCNMAFRRHALLEAGLCDERYIGGFFREDNDIFARVKQAGYRVVFVPEAELVHLESAGGSRTERGERDRKRQFSVFHNDTLFHLRCLRPAPVPFLWKQVRWAYAVKKTRGYSWADFAYLLGAFARALRSHYVRPVHQLSQKHGLDTLQPHRKRTARG